MKTLPRVLLLTNSLAVGGAETQLVRLAVHLRAAGYPVMVATILPDGRGRPELRDAGIHHEVLPLRRPVGGLTVMAGAIRLFRRWKPDAVVSFLFYANVLARLAAAVTRVPAVVSSVRTERFGGWMSDVALRMTDGLATLTVTNSHTVARRLAADRVVPKDRMIVIPNGVPLEEFGGHRDRDATRVELGVSNDEFLWLAVGRLEPIKDYPTLLRAMVALRGSGLPVQLRVAADGSQRAVLERLVRDLGLSGNVRLLGLRRDVPRLLAAGDALVLTSLWEGLPNVVIEAMAAGLPVVATNRGGTTELVVPGETGYLVPPREPLTLAAAMTTLMELPEGRRLGMGEVGRRTVTERFELNGAMGRWEELIGDITRATPRVGAVASRSGSGV